MWEEANKLKVAFNINEAGDEDQYDIFDDKDDVGSHLATKEEDDPKAYLRLDSVASESDINPGLRLTT